MIPDLSQLQMLESLLRERSLTRTAAQLGMTQPTVSRTLARLRLHFGDPLFVRAGQRMEPTARALELAEPVAAVLAAARQLQGGSAAFDPALAERAFGLYMVDGAIVHVLPRLLAGLSQRAPGIRLRSVNCDPHSLERQMEQGQIDLAIGRFPDLVNNIHQRTLWCEGYATLMRRDHPCALGMDREAFIANRHVLISMDHTNHQYTAVTRTLEAVLPASHVLCHVPSFTVAAHIVLHTDALAIMPRMLADGLARDLGLAVADSPLDLPRLELALYWHERCHRDPANQWLRQFARSALVADLDAAPAGCQGGA
ncbi:LysR family transcriptional regulator [Massilia niastensis]|uniref:LysR family transcriptional regulator n=1 Tax=Massilia niastensis TaxID=544911 RepID=UPI000376ED66|nr:LysR family transcriptional regulator [Massilia niastensis]